MNAPKCRKTKRGENYHAVCKSGKYVSLADYSFGLVYEHCSQTDLVTLVEILQIHYPKQEIAQNLHLGLLPLLNCNKLFSTLMLFENCNKTLSTLDYWDYKYQRVSIRIRKKIIQTIRHQLPVKGKANERQVQNSSQNGAQAVSTGAG